MRVSPRVAIPGEFWCPLTNSTLQSIWFNYSGDAFRITTAGPELIGQADLLQGVSPLTVGLSQDSSRLIIACDQGIVVLNFRGEMTLSTPGAYSSATFSADGNAWSLRFTGDGQALIDLRHPENGQVLSSIRVPDPMGANNGWLYSASSVSGVWLICGDGQGDSVSFEVGLDGNSLSARPLLPRGWLPIAYHETTRRILAQSDTCSGLSIWQYPIISPLVIVENWKPDPDEGEDSFPDYTGFFLSNMADQTPEVVVRDGETMRWYVCNGDTLKPQEEIIITHSHDSQPATASNVQQVHVHSLHQHGSLVVGQTGGPGQPSLLVFSVSDFLQT